jgi:preprotein translocase subunit SecA
MFTSMLESIKREVVSILITVQIKQGEDLHVVDQKMHHEPEVLQFQHEKAKSLTANDDIHVEDNLEPDNLPYTRTAPKVGRNAECPCGSGKKYKQCHGKLVN